MNIFFGIVGIVFSFLLLIYRVPIKHFMGKIEWAEEKFGQGGTYTFMLIFSVALFFISLMIMTDTLGILIEPFSLFFSRKK